MDDIEVKCFLKAYFAVRFKVSDCEMFSNLNKVSKFSQPQDTIHISSIALLMCAHRDRIISFSVRLRNLKQCSMQPTYLVKLLVTSDRISPHCIVWILIGLKFSYVVFTNKELSIWLEKKCKTTTSKMDNVSISSFHISTFLQKPTFCK